jgi:hypothetical protein
MSDDEENAGEIKLNTIVLNTDYLVSDDESDQSEDFDEIKNERSRLKSVDEKTEENAEILGELLTEIASVEPTSKNVIRVELYNKKKDFLKKNEDVEFDINEYGYPFIPAECEEYLLPFLEEMKNMRKELKGTKIETNSKKISYKF